MDSQLQEIKDAVEPATGEPDFDKARQLATTYVDANPDKYTEDIFADALSTRDIGPVVQAVETLRTAGMSNAQWQAEAWLLRYVPPQDIGGTYHPQLVTP